MLKATRADALKLFMEGTKALSDVEYNGIRVDVTYLQNAKKDIDKKISEVLNELSKDEIYKVWKEEYKSNMKLASPAQLGKILFEKMNYEPLAYTETDQYKTDKIILEHLDLPFTKQYIYLKELEKAKKSLLEIEEETIDGYIHPVQNLHTVRSYRGCIAKGTMIDLALVIIPIEDVKKDDFIYCYDDNLNLKIRKVLWAGKTGRKKVIRVHWLTKGRKGYLDLTPEHKIRLASGKYIEAQNLIEDEKLLDNYSVVKIEWINKEVDVYDIEVEEHHNFIANEICVHNSSNSPNGQNWPTRNKEISKIIRTCFIPRKNHVLIENDFGQHEVKIAAAHNKDPVLIDYVSDSKSDMHLDLATDIFMLPREEIHKDARFYAKNQFTFAEFYGSFYKQCAPLLWGSMERFKLKTNSGKLLIDHLREKGIKKIGLCEMDFDDPKSEPLKGTFEYHLRDVEKRLWTKFKVYAQWKRDYWEQYKTKGYMDFPTGFRAEGVYNKNTVLSYSIQGCLQGKSKVLTRNGGWIPIKELEGREVEVWTGFEWSKAIGLNKGKSKLAIIHLSSGLDIYCDIRHKLKNENNEWVKFDNLKSGDYVALPRTSQPMNPSKEMNWEFVLGFIIGDGYLANRIVDKEKRRKYLQIVVGRKKKEILDNIDTFLNGEGFSPRRRIVPSKGNKNEKYSLTLENKNFVKLLESKGLIFDWNSHTKEVPESIWRSNLQQQRDFMEGLWLSDGCLASNEKMLNLQNPKILKQIQILSSSLGFDSYLDKRSALRFNWKRKNGKASRIYPENIVKNMNLDIKPENYGKELLLKCYRHRNYRKRSKIRQYMAEEMIERNSKENNPEIYRYDKIVSIEILEKEEETFTMSVDNPLHQFVADGVITKNSAFHCELWSLIEQNNWLKKKKMKSRIVNQIHDCVLGDVHKNEVEDYIENIKYLAEVKLRQEWKWIIVPLLIETEICTENWFGKDKFDLNNWREFQSRT